MLLITGFGTTVTARVILAASVLAFAQSGHTHCRSNEAAAGRRVNSMIRGVHG
jgi:hypothetical protein